MLTSRLHHQRAKVALAALFLVTSVLFATVETERDTENRRRLPPTLELPGAEPVIGTNFTHHEVQPACSLQGSGVVATYHQDGVPEKVQRHLADMRTSGIESVRLLVWHQPQVAVGEAWGVVPATNGRLAEPYRTNLRRYVTDVRNAGFARLTLAMAPTGLSSPRHHDFGRSRLDENWGVIADVTEMAKAEGPRSIGIDLLNDGPPGLREPDWTRKQVISYLSEVYGRYVRTWGSVGASVSIIASQSAPDSVARLAAFVDAVRHAGAEPPAWFDLHLSYDPVLAAAILNAVNAYLSAEQLPQPLLVSEAAYNDADVARELAAFSNSSGRRIAEVLMWPLTRDKPCLDISVAPPYRADHYAAALR